MAITITPLHPLFGAEIGGVDVGGPLDDATFGEIRAALDEYSLLVFHDQKLDDARQVAFSERFGPLVFAATIPMSAKVDEAHTRGQTVMQYAPKSAPALAYMQLVGEVLSNGRATNRGGVEAKRGARAIDAA